MSDVAIVATARVMPEFVVTNQDIGERLIAGVKDHPSWDPDAMQEAIENTRARSELIEKKTGLRARRFYDPGTSPVSLGLEMLERMLPDDDWGALDAIIVSSSSTQGFPGVSQQIVAAARAKHAALGNPYVLDINSNACTSFMYALTTGSALIKGMGFRKVACLAIEFSSRCISYDPRSFGTSTLFGDAAAGIILQGGVAGIARIASSRASSMVDQSTIGLIKGGGVQASDLTRDVPENVRWYMAGPPVAIGAQRILVDEIKRYRAEGATIDWLIPHQANLTRILIPACKAADLDPNKLRASFAETGNTSSASIPLLLDELVRSKEVSPGQTVLMIGFGASFSLGSALLVLEQVNTQGS